MMCEGMRNCKSHDIEIGKAGTGWGKHSGASQGSGKLSSSKHVNWCIVGAPTIGSAPPFNPAKRETSSAGSGGRQD